MKHGIWKAWVLLGMLACAPIASADTEEDPVPEDVATGCRVVAEGLSFITGYLVGKEFGDFGKALSVHLATKFGPDAVNKRCKDYYRSLEEEKENFDYNRFVDTVCNGNPLACPNGWNALSHLPGTPRDCYMYTVCNLSLAVASDNSLSVKDMLNAGAFIDLSHRRGYWDYDNFGYLVGVSGTKSLGDLEIY
ncbi:hypothetical protein [Thioalkalivibrio sp. XN279]|uniref:hypothetical protein n=1 Tax=Thioalkalivibrio sp. XN279 TaxID=2714953 RepID=UPI00140AF24F|nr:hypothetical protein [Thioalkalivibrio sp. XN279]NHA15995.1 hypothetical protein [Thioalkalivibrio sp. XN279]